MANGYEYYSPLSYLHSNDDYPPNITVTNGNSFNNNHISTSNKGTPTPSNGLSSSSAFQNLSSSSSPSCMYPQTSPPSIFQSAENNSIPRHNSNLTHWNVNGQMDVSNSNFAEYQNYHQNVYHNGYHNGNSFAFSSPIPSPFPSQQHTTNKNNATDTFNGNVSVINNEYSQPITCTSQYSNNSSISEYSHFPNKPVNEVGVTHFNPPNYALEQYNHTNDHIGYSSYSSNVNDKNHNQRNLENGTSDECKNTLLTTLSNTNTILGNTFPSTHFDYGLTGIDRSESENDSGNCSGISSTEYYNNNNHYNYITTKTNITPSTFDESNSNSSSTILKSTTPDHHHPSATNSSSSSPHAPPQEFQTCNGVTTTENHHETPIINPHCMYGSSNSIVTPWPNDISTNRLTTTSNQTNFNNNLYQNHTHTFPHYTNTMRRSAVRNLKHMAPENSEQESNGSVSRNVTANLASELNTNNKQSTKETTSEISTGEQGFDIVPNVKTNTGSCENEINKTMCAKVKEKSGNLENHINHKNKKNAKSAKLSRLSQYYQSLFGNDERRKVEDGDNEYQNKCNDRFGEITKFEENELDSGNVEDKSEDKATTMDLNTDDIVSKTAIVIGPPTLYMGSEEGASLKSSSIYSKNKKEVGPASNSSSLLPISILCCKCHTTNKNNNIVSSSLPSLKTPFSSIASKLAPLKNGNKSLHFENGDEDDHKNSNSGVKMMNKNDEIYNVDGAKQRNTGNKVRGMTPPCVKGGKRSSKKRERDVQNEVVGGQDEDKGDIGKCRTSYREMGIVMETCDDVTKTDIRDDVSSDTIKVKEETLGRHLCLGCQKPVCDRYVLHVRDHGYWHADCLKCSNCQDNLSTHKSCYVKNEQIFCRNDYNILFGQSCVKCSLQFKKEQDWMRIAGQNRYHIACFLCKICKRQLGNNEKYHLVNGTDIYCTNHYRDMVSGDSSEEGQQPAKKAKRNRTSYTEAQIKFLQERFLHDSNPDGNELEKIANHINLKKRVVQVWFQNNRARLKKTANNTKGNNQDLSGQSNSKGRVATPGSISDSALTMDWDNSLDPAILEDQGYISPSTSTTTTPTHQHHHPHHHLQHHHHHHHHPQQQQHISPSTPHYQDLFGSESGSGAGGAGDSSSTVNHLHNALGSGVHHPTGHGVLGEPSNEQPASFAGSESMALTPGPHNSGNGNGDTTGSGSICGDPQPHEDNALSSLTSSGEESGLNFDADKINTSLRSSNFVNEKHPDSLRKMDPRDRHEQQIRQMMHYHEQQQQQQQHFQHQYNHHLQQQQQQNHPFTAMYNPHTNGPAGFNLSPYYATYGAPHLYPNNNNDGIMGNDCPSPTNNLPDPAVSPQNFIHQQQQIHQNHQHHHLQHLSSLSQQPLLQTTDKDGQILASSQDPYYRNNNNHHHQHNHNQQQQTQESTHFQLSPRDQKPLISGTNSSINNNDNTMETDNHHQNLSINTNKNGNHNTSNTASKNSFKHTTDSSSSLFDDKIPSTSPTPFYAINSNSNNNSAKTKLASLSSSPPSHFTHGRKNTHSNPSTASQQGDNNFPKREGTGYRSPVSCNGGRQHSVSNSSSSNNHHHSLHHQPQHQQHIHHQQQHHQQNPYQFVPISQNGKSAGEIHYFGHGRLGEISQHHGMESDAISDES